MDRTMRVRGLVEFDLIVGLTVEYLSTYSKEFVSSRNGWVSFFLIFLHKNFVNML